MQKYHSPWQDFELTDNKYWRLENISGIIYQLAIFLGQHIKGPIDLLKLLVIKCPSLVKK